jgi:hypothetical protein
MVMVTQIAVALIRMVTHGGATPGIEPVATTGANPHIIALTTTTITTTTT